MPLDPQAEALIAREAGGTPTEQMTVEDVRDNLVERRRLSGGQPQAVARVDDLPVPGPGGSIPLRVYTPLQADQPPLPGLVFFHGGGWVCGSLETADVLCRELANAAGCVVVSVAYRLAPEAKFPAAVDDCVAATRWVAEHGWSLGIDASRLAIGGDSAGGNLAAAVSVILRDSGGPPLTFQLLLYPVTNYNFETESYRTNATGYVLTREAMRFYWRHYLRDDTDADDHRASPLRAPNLRGLPPALVITAEFDPLRDEGRAYAARLRDAGVAVTHTEYSGMIHGFFGSTGVLDQGKLGVAEAGAALRAAFRVVTLATPA